MANIANKVVLGEKLMEESSAAVTSVQQSQGVKEGIVITQSSVNTTKTNTLLQVKLVQSTRCTCPTSSLRTQITETGKSNLERGVPLPTFRNQADNDNETLERNWMNCPVTLAVGCSGRGIQNEGYTSVSNKPPSQAMVLKEFQECSNNTCCLKPQSQNNDPSLGRFSGSICRNSNCSALCAVITSFNEGRLTIDEIIEYVQDNVWTHQEMLHINSILKQVGCVLIPVKDSSKPNSNSNLSSIHEGNSAEYVNQKGGFRPHSHQSPINVNNCGVQNGLLTSSPSDRYATKQGKDAICSEIRTKPVDSIGSVNPLSHDILEKPAPLSQQFLREMTQKNKGKDAETETSTDAQPELRRSNEKQSERRRLSSFLVDPATLSAFFTFTESHVHSESHTSKTTYNAAGLGGVVATNCEKPIGPFPLSLDLKRQQQNTLQPSSRSRSERKNETSQELHNMVEPLVTTFLHQFIVEICGILSDRLEGEGESGGSGFNAELSKIESVTCEQHHGHVNVQPQSPTEGLASGHGGSTNVELDPASPCCAAKLSSGSSSSGENNETISIPPTSNLPLKEQ